MFDFIPNAIHPRHREQGLEIAKKKQMAKAIWCTANIVKEKIFPLVEKKKAATATSAGK